MSSCQSITEKCVADAFLAAPPLISQQILDLSIKHPNWLRDLYEVEEWPRGNGTIMEQLVFRGELPAIERGFADWKKLNNNTNYGCHSCEGPDCGYNWTQFGGHGFDRKLTELMRREFRSPSYCISEIQTTAHFKEVFAKVVENLYAQVDFFKEMNIGLNFLTGLAKKYVIDSTGARPNIANPYVYPAIGAARLSTLNISLLEFFYEQMRRMPDAVPFDVVNGSPVFALICSHQLLARLYRDDPNLRQDVRFSGLANDLVLKYNFMSTIRGMFLPAPVLYPRRFNWDATTNNWVEELPFINGIPAEAGTYTGFNPGYEAATHEEVIIHGKYPFKVFHLPSETTLGENSSFGPEYSFLNAWQWVNPQTVQDPFRRVGYFASSAAIGLSQQFSEGIFGILVERPQQRTMATFLPEPTCPPTPTDCSNAIPNTGCPCPLILGVTPHPTSAGHYFVMLAVPTSATVGQTIQFGLDTGGYITGTIVTVSADGYSVEVTFPDGTDPTLCTHFTTVFCENTLGCSSDVLSATDCRSSILNSVNVVLKHPIKADTAGDVVWVTFGDCSSAEMVVVSVDMMQNLWVLQYNTGYGPADDPTGGAAGDTVDILCDRCGILTVCVPPGTDPTCPPCTMTPTNCNTSPSFSPSASVSSSPSASPSASASGSPSASVSSSPSSSPSASASGSPSASPSSSPSSSPSA